MSNFLVIYLHEMKKEYRKILLIRPGRIYTDKWTKDKFDGSIFGWGGLYSGRLILGRKNTSNCNLLNLLFSLFSSIKHVFWHFLHRTRCEICCKLTIKTLEYLKVNDKVKNKDTSWRRFGLCSVNFEHFWLLVTVFVSFTLIT